jgi:hypothetical protein
MTAHQAIAKVQLYATIDGVLVDVSMFKCDYAMNSIPTGTLMLATGWDIKTGAASNAHGLLANINSQTPVEVYLSYRTLGATSNYVLQPDGDYLMFRGWVSGCGYRRMHNQFGLAIDVVHWLSALGFSSMLGEGIHPGNPFNLSFPASTSITGDPSSFSLFGTDLGGLFANIGSMASDFWGNALLPWLYSIANIEHLKFTDLAVQVPIDSGGLVTWAFWQFRGAQLPLRTSGIDGDYLGQAIAHHMASVSLSASSEYAAMANMTFWDKLVGDFASTYMFSIIPYPSMAKVVPFTPGLRDYWDPWGLGYTFPSSQSSSVSIQAIMPRTIRAVGLIAGNGSTSGVSRDPVTPSMHQIGGWYDSYQNGMISIRQAPAFLSELPGASQALWATGAQTGLKSNAFSHPGAGSDPPGTLLRSPRQYVENNRGILDNLAHALYVSEVLRHRTGSLYGPLRFDVAPGSTVKFEAPMGAYTLGVQTTGQPFFATVTGVSYLLDAVNSQAGVGYQLAHIRSDKENELDATSTASHPLYTANWYGDYFVGS